MARAEFEEKEFEVAAAIELAVGASGFGPVYSSGQVLERLLGYDAAAAPAPTHPIWQVLRVPRPPGVRLVPAHWAPGDTPPSDRLPPTPVSLTLQHKRPEYLRGGTAGQWWMWRQPYLRFSTSTAQQRVLLRLHRALGGRALVRYAAPAFWRRGDFEAAILRRSVLAEAGFVSPGRLAGHRVWTYVRPGTLGQPNPRGRRGPFETVDQLLSSLRPTSPTGRDIVPADATARHVAQIARAARQREPVLRRRLDRWERDLTRMVPEITDRQRRAVVDVATVVSLLTRQGATWHLIEGP